MSVCTKKTALHPRIAYHFFSDTLIMRLNTLLDDRFATHHRIETVYLISGIVDGALQTISIDQTVRALDIVAITMFGLLFNVAGVAVMHGVRERVLSGGIDIVRVYDRHAGMLMLDHSGSGWTANGCNDGQMLYVMLLLLLLLMQMQMLSVDGDSEQNDCNGIL